MTTGFHSRVYAALERRLPERRRLYAARLADTFEAAGRNDRLARSVLSTVSGIARAELEDRAALVWGCVNDVARAPAEQPTLEQVRAALREFISETGDELRTIAELTAPDTLRLGASVDLLVPAARSLIMRYEAILAMSANRFLPSRPEPNR